jgi:hypothetical protein
MELDNAQRTNNELNEKLELEKNVLYDTISLKEKELEQTEYLVFHKLPSDFSNFEFLFDKEKEIHNKMKLEHNNLLVRNETLKKELINMIKTYKETASISLEKTKEGFLRLTFYNLDIKGKESYIVVEIKEGNFKVIEKYPNLNIYQLEEELQVNCNFTVFMTKLANLFINYFNSI